MMGAMLAGCSDASEAGTGAGKASVEASQSAQESSAEKTEEASVAASESETSVEVSEPESSEPASSSSAAVEEGVTTVDAAKQEELLAKYKEYFNNYDESDIRFDIKMTGSTNGMNIDLNMVIAVSDGSSYMSYSVPNGGSMDMYITKDKMAYLKLTSNGADPVYYKASGLENSSMEEMNLASGVTDAAANNDHLQYYGTKVIDGKTYDILTTDEEGTKVYFYMNRDNGEWERLTAKEEDYEMIATVSKSGNTFNLPSEFTSAQEIDSQELYMTMALSLYSFIASPALD